MLSFLVGGKMKKNKILTSSISIIGIILILFQMIFPINASLASVEVGDSIYLKEGKELPGLLQIKSNGALKLVVRVYYDDPETKQRLWAFCVEPDKERYWYRCWKWVLYRFNRGNKRSKDMENIIWGLFRKRLDRNIIRE